MNLEELIFLLLNGKSDVFKFIKDVYNQTKNIPDTNTNNLNIQGIDNKYAEYANKITGNSYGGTGNQFNFIMNSDEIKAFNAMVRNIGSLVKDEPPSRNLLEERFNNLQERHNSLLESEREKNETIKALENEKNNLQTQLKTAQAAVLPNDKIDPTINNYINENKNLNDKITEINSQITLLQNENTSLKNENNSLQNNLPSPVIPGSVPPTVPDNSTIINNLTTENQSQKEQITSLTNMNSILETQLKTAQVAVLPNNMINPTIERYINENKQLTQKNQELTQQNNQLQTQVIKTNETPAIPIQSSQENPVLMQQIAQLTQQNQELTQKNNELQNNVSTMGGPQVVDTMGGPSVVDTMGGPPVVDPAVPPPVADPTAVPPPVPAPVPAPNTTVLPPPATNTAVNSNEIDDLNKKIEELEKQLKNEKAGYKRLKDEKEAAKELNEKIRKNNGEPDYSQIYMFYNRKKGEQDNGKLKMHVYNKDKKSKSFYESFNNVINNSIEDVDDQLLFMNNYLSGESNENSPVVPTIKYMKNDITSDNGALKFDPYEMSDNELKNIVKQ
jgi:hypothetical protein